jgi:DNA-binding transcriptional LysR family regulator
MIHPSIPQLEAFYWISRLGSIKEAAHHLNMAQPTISLRVADLEDQLGYPIFERAHRKLTLTRQGERLLPRVTSIINELASLRQFATNAEDIAGVVRVGVTEVLAQSCLSTCMKYLQRQFPELKLDIAVATSTELEMSVMGRQLDLAYIINPRGDPALTMTQLGIQEASWMASPALGLPAIVTPGILATKTIVTSPWPSPMYQLIVDWFRDGGLEPSDICRCTSIAVAAQLVRNGLGAGFLPLKLVSNDLRSGRLVKLGCKKQPAPARVFCVFRSADRSRPADAVRGIFAEVIDDMKFLKPENRPHSATHRSASTSAR